MEYRIRPSARLISTIGKDLVKDKYTAIVELVKNSYDADASYSYICVEYKEEEQQLSLSVEDDGHGMDLDTVVNTWLVPATPDKLDRKTSYGGRPLQGRKGIGRFAAAILGSEIYLLTNNNRAKEVLLTLDLNDFSKDKYLHDVPVEVEEGAKGGSQGTYLEATSHNISAEEVADAWNVKERGKLLTELKKLLAPHEVEKIGRKLGYLKKVDKFSIQIEFKGMPHVDNKVIDIKPFDIVDMYDYRMHGSVDAKGNCSLSYYNQNVPSIGESNLKIKVFLDDKKNQEFPGDIRFDFRVFDRDPESIDELINRGLVDPATGEKAGKRKAREILDEYYGVSLYRGMFRIRPYGDSDFDWLGLDKLRVQNPSNKIGHNQVIGFINVLSEEHSSLIEKSARDGLVENKYYSGLKFILLSVMAQLEEKRRSFRDKALRGRKPKSLDKKIEDLFDYSNVSKRLRDKLIKSGISDDNQQRVLKLVDKEMEVERKSKSEDLDKIRETIALYQGQATLGKITYVLLHEGRKHLKIINEVPPRLGMWVEQLLSEDDEELRIKLDDRAKVLVESSKSLGHLFKRISPLATTRRPPRKDLVLVDEINKVEAIFEEDFRKNDVKFEVFISEDAEVYSTSFDLVTVFANLIENSMYWMGVEGKPLKNIRIEADRIDGILEITYQDSGPGFQGTNLDLMFEPGFSMKPDGTGLGLALVGESLERMNGCIRAVESDIGAYFVISIKGK